MKNLIILFVFAVLLAAAGCKESPDPLTDRQKLNDIAERYVVLSLNLGKYDENYIDAYFGPESFKEKSDAESIKLDSIRKSANVLLDELNGLKLSSSTVYRIHNLREFILSLKNYADYLSGKSFDFDEESEAFYGVTAPHFSSEHYAEINERISALLPDTVGTVSERYEKMKSKYIVPHHKVRDVFNIAIEEARKRTTSRIELPHGETFSVEYVSGKSWGAYNWFQGDAKSLIQVNTELPFPVNNALRLACHEGYPGHHVFHSLIEKEYVNAKSWVEYSVYPLFSPLSLISEGTANAAASVAFPGDELVDFEIEVLCPAAGIDTAGYRDYVRVNELISELAPIGPDVARSYLDGYLSRKQAVEYLVTYGCRSQKRAEMNIDFFEKYRSYIVNYSVGLQITEKYLEKQTANTAFKEKARWDAFYGLLTVPMMPKDLGEYVN